MWAGPMFPLLIMQLVICAGIVIVNGVGLVIRDFDVSRTVLLVAFGMLLVWLLATLVGVMRLRATERRAATNASEVGEEGGSVT
ncbi:hypothetical protein C1N74_03975 [Microbacterium sp. SGAir0570]|nr:hypothetical protein C1N74_03975 [Microbacterium sp. SGAir0570]